MNKSEIEITTNMNYKYKKKLHSKYDKKIKITCKNKNINI